MLSSRRTWERCVEEAATEAVGAGTRERLLDVREDTSCCAGLLDAATEVVSVMARAPRGAPGRTLDVAGRVGALEDGAVGREVVALEEEDPTSDLCVEEVSNAWA